MAGQNRRTPSKRLRVTAITLSTPLWAGPTHMSATGENWAAGLQTPLLAGDALLLATVAHIRRGESRLARITRRAQVAQAPVGTARTSG